MLHKYISYKHINENKTRLEKIVQHEMTSGAFCNVLRFITDKVGIDVTSRPGGFRFESRPRHLINCQSIFVVFLSPSRVNPGYYFRYVTALLSKSFTIFHQHSRINTDSNSLTLCSWVLLDKATVAQLPQKFLKFYRNRKLITFFTKARQWSLSWAIYSTHPSLLL
jgi:hypothetical protein